MKSLRLVILIATTLHALFVPGVVLALGEAVIEKNFSVGIFAGKSTAIRLENVAVGTHLDLSVTGDGELGVLVLDELNYSLYPRAYSPLFSGSLHGEMEISLLPPVAGDYFVVFNNTAGVTNRSVKLDLRARRAIFKPLNNAELNASMSSIVSSLKKILLFDDLAIRPVSCEFANLLAVGDQIYLCIEYVSMLRQEAGDRESARSLLLFAILHEISHVLLRQWAMPFHANEEIADQMATSLAVMMGFGQAALAQADFFAEMAATQRDTRPDVAVGRHPLAAQRARNIRRWALAGPEHVRAWQPFLVPHMQTVFLSHLQKKLPRWGDRNAIDLELSAREELAGS